VTGFPVVYERASAPSGGPRPGAKALMRWCLEHYTDATNLGIYNPRRVRGSSSAWSIHAEGRAIDVGFPVVEPGGDPDGGELADRLVEHATELGVQQVIWARRIWRNTRPGWRSYGGTSPHLDHIHAELTRAAGNDLIYNQVSRILAKEDPVNDHQIEEWFVSRLVQLYRYTGPNCRDATPGDINDWVRVLRARGYGQAAATLSQVEELLGSEVPR